MSLERAGNNILVVVILFFVFLLIYSRTRNQTLKETFMQLKEIFGDKSE